MESSSPRQATTLASIIDAEKVIAPARARALLATLERATAIPDGPAGVREWSEAILVDRDASGNERAVFSNVTGSPSPGPRGASVSRHVEALRAAAVAMLWGRESAQGPDGQPRLPRLRRLLVDSWEETRGRCDDADKFMMFFDATLALDRAAEPKSGREGFKTLSIPSMGAVKKDVKVGTIGVPFEAIVDTGKFKKAARPEQFPPVSQPVPQPSAAVPVVAKRSMMPVIAGVVAVVVLGALAFVFLAR